MGKTERHIQNSKKFGDKLKGLTLELDETMVLYDVVPLRAFKRHHRETLRYGNFSPTFPEVLLAHASPIDWPIVVKHANMTSSRDSIRISFTIDSCKMTSYCRSCAGPIENPPDNHDHCIACLSLAHAEAAVCVLTCCSIKTHTSSQKELFSPHSVSAMQLAPPQSSAEPPPTQRIITHHLPAHPLTKLLKLLYQSLKAWKVILGISRWLLGVIKHGYTLQFRRRPPRFKGVVQSLTFASKRAVSETRGMQSARKRSDRKSPISDPSTEHLASIHSGC